MEQIEKLRHETSLYSESNKTLREERDRLRRQLEELRVESGAAAKAREELQQRVK